MGLITGVRCWFLPTLVPVELKACPVDWQLTLRGGSKSGRSLGLGQHSSSQPGALSPTGLLLNLRARSPCILLKSTFQACPRLGEREGEDWGGGVALVVGKERSRKGLRPD